MQCFVWYMIYGKLEKNYFRAIIRVRAKADCQMAGRLALIQQCIID